MFFQKGIELTPKDIVSVIHTGRVEQTPVASSFIETVERELGIVVVACYVQSYERMVIPEESKRRRFFQFQVRKAKLLLQEHPEFERRMELTVYLDAPLKSCRQQMIRAVKSRMVALFLQTLAEHGITVPYPRLLTNEEFEAYGFNGKRPEERDNSVIVQPDGPVPERYDLTYDSFPGLVFWHVYSDSCSGIQRYLRERKDYPSIRVYCQWDKEQEQETIWLCFSFRWEIEQFLSRPDAAEIRADCLKIIARHDPWGLVSDANYRPVLKVWNELSEETRGCLLRG